MRYNKVERAFLVKKYHETKSCTRVQRAWRSHFRTKSAPDYNAIMLAVSKFESLGFVDSLPPVHTTNNQEREKAKNQLQDLFSEKPNLSLRKAACAVGFSYSTVRTILIDELHLKPYKYHMCHKLKPEDYPKRVDFAHWFLSLPPGTPEFFIVSDEAYFYLTESVNKQNNRNWAESSPENFIEVPLHPENVHVWCAISAKRIFGPFYFEESVKKENYLEMLQTFFWPKLLRTADYKKYYFQQDGAAAHTSNIVQSWCTSKFGEKFLNKEMWPPRSPDLNPCDFFYGVILNLLCIIHCRKHYKN